ncbi:hypothetical protein VNO78_03828 [Psophocarpus tetragonolobus]|uniref:Uncharacterized protein n=1 Tax=Psophocarpus tetragonolobus TaxID=3891 RepID=A0AAN9T507_PSOTE
MLIPTRSLRPREKAITQARDSASARFIFQKWSQRHQRFSIPGGLSTRPPNIRKARNSTLHENKQAKIDSHGEIEMMEGSPSKLYLR